MSIDTDNVGVSADETNPVARSPRRRKLLLVAMAAALGVVAVGGATAAAMAKHVTITVDGQDRQISTLSGSVSGALDAAGLTMGEHDVLAPAADTAISDGSHIALERGRQLTVSSRSGPASVVGAPPSVGTRSVRRDPSTSAAATIQRSSGDHCAPGGESAPLARVVRAPSSDSTPTTCWPDPEVERARRAPSADHVG